MNYAIVIAGFVAVFSMIWYRFTSYTGPRTQDVMGSGPGERGGAASTAGDEEARDYATFA